MKSNLTTLEEIPKVENSYHRPLDGGIKEQKTQPLFTLSVTNLSFLCSNWIPFTTKKVIAVFQWLQETRWKPWSYKPINSWQPIYQNKNIFLVHWILLFGHRFICILFSLTFWCSVIWILRLAQLHCCTFTRSNFSWYFNQAFSRHPYSTRPSNNSHSFNIRYGTGLGLQPRRYTYKIGASWTWFTFPC